MPGPQRRPSTLLELLTFGPRIVYSSSVSLRVRPTRKSGRRGGTTMAKTYRLGTAQRLANRVFQWMTNHGIGARYRYILTVPGRKSGLAHSTPVDVMEIDGTRWLV